MVKDSTKISQVTAVTYTILGGLTIHVYRPAGLILLQKLCKLVCSRQLLQ